MVSSKETLIKSYFLDGYPSRDKTILQFIRHLPALSIMYLAGACAKHISLRVKFGNDCVWKRSSLEVGACMAPKGFVHMHMYPSINMIIQVLL